MVNEPGLSKEFLDLVWWKERDDIVCRDANEVVVTNDSEGIVSIRLKVCADCKTSQKMCVCSAMRDGLALVWNLQDGFYEETIRIILENATLAQNIKGVEAAAAATPTTSAPAPATVAEPTPIHNVSFKDRALLLVSRGVPVTPLRPKTKIAVLKGWEGSASTDVEQIERWNAENADYNCAAVAQAKTDGFWFLELDKPEVSERIKAETGKKIPATMTVRSSPGRGHIYFKQSQASLAMGNIAQGFVKGGDWSARVDRQYVVGPLSIHVRTGLPYDVLGSSQIVEAPEWLIDWLISQKVEKKTADARDDGGPILEHGRNTRLTSIGGKLREAGSSHDEIEWTLLRMNSERCQPPLDDSEVKTIAGSVARYEVEKDSTVLVGGVVAGTAPTNARPVYQASDMKQAIDDVDENSEASIPPFDPSVMDGIYKKFVEVATNGTTLAPQFVYAIAKAVVGARMAGQVKFEDLDVEPLSYLAMIGITGTGKGEAWRRVFKILTSNGVLDGCCMKIINSADSGAGLKDAFFDPPESQPILCYIDEVVSLGNKSKDTRNPGILDTMVELADSTSISRVLAKRGKEKATRTKHDARLVIVMCGQDREVYVSSFAGRTKLGWWDRLTPEYGVPQETGDLPPIDDAQSASLLLELNALDYSGTMKMAAESKALLKEFWEALPAEVRTKARWKKHLQLDAYLLAFGRGVKIVEKTDMERAIKTFARQIVLRRVFFHGEAPDRVGYYLGLIKDITERMRKQLKAGTPPDQAAKSFTEYERKTNAGRNNEEHIFGKAMQVHSRVHLYEADITGLNGHTYRKYLPNPFEED